MEDWSTSEKSVYGQSFLAVNGGGVQVGISRKPTPVSHFVKTIVGIVNGHSYGSGSNIPLFARAFYKLGGWLRGDTVSVGAGAATYALASKLPSFILDALVNLPHFLISVRNALLPVTPTRRIPAGQLPPPVTQQRVVTRTHEDPIPPPQVHIEVQSPPAVATQTPDEETGPSDETRSNPWSGNDTDVESNAGDASAVESSWVNLQEKRD